jgi:hypothetical protein
MPGPVPVPETKHKPVILFALCDGFLGSGDLMFPLKLRKEFKRYAEETLGIQNTAIKLVAPDSPTITSQLRSLIAPGNDIEILTPKQLGQKVKAGLKIASVIEGPMFNDDFIKDIDRELQTHGERIPLIMQPEYGWRGFDANISKPRRVSIRKALSKLQYVGLIKSGLNKQEGEKGIILTSSLSDSLTTSDANLDDDLDDDRDDDLDGTVRTALLGNSDPSDYHGSTDLFFQYSHDTALLPLKNYFFFWTRLIPDLFDELLTVPAATVFLQVLRIFNKFSEKENVDVLMVGSSYRFKHNALIKIKEKLIEDGFAKISFYNVDTEEKEYLAGSETTEGRHFRVVYKNKMTHKSMLAAQALSGDLAGATGDQSLSEAVSAGKVVVYECLAHKVNLFRDYYDSLLANPACDADCEQALNCISKNDHDALDKIFTKQIREKLIRVSGVHAQSESVNLTSTIAISALPIESIIVAIEKGNLSPFFEDAVYGSPFRRILKLGRFDAALKIIKDVANDQLDNEVVKNAMSEALMEKNAEGNTYLSLLRTTGPNDIITICHARRLVIKYNIENCQQPVQGSERATMLEAIKALCEPTTTSADPAENNEKVIQKRDDALIGALLSLANGTSSESRRLETHAVGFFSGTRSCENVEHTTLQALGLNLSQISEEEWRRYENAFLSAQATSQACCAP